MQVSFLIVRFGPQKHASSPPQWPWGEDTEMMKQRGISQTQNSEMGMMQMHQPTPKSEFPNTTPASNLPRNDPVVGEPQFLLGGGDSWCGRRMSIHSPFVRAPDLTLLDELIGLWYGTHGSMIKVPPLCLVVRSYRILRYDKDMYEFKFSSFWKIHL